MPLDLNRSDWDHKLEKPEPQQDYAIRLGLRLINGFSKTSAELLLQIRQQLGGWQCFRDFAETTHLPRDDMTALAATDIFKQFGYERSGALWQAEAAPYLSSVDFQEDEIDWLPEAALERIQKDFKAFKTSLGDHPVAVIKKQQWPYLLDVDKLSLSCTLINLPADTDVFVFGMVLVKQSPGSAKGMVFVTLEDEKGFLNLAFTPQVYTHFYQQVDQQPYLCVVGKLQRVNESHSILVKRVFITETSASLLPMRQRGKNDAKMGAVMELVKPRAFH